MYKTHPSEVEFLDHIVVSYLLEKNNYCFIFSKGKIKIFGYTKTYIRMPVTVLFIKMSNGCPSTGEQINIMKYN